ncbi:helix-turn-helix transcriptional regulator [Haloplanus halophilus]|uniref:helix-turn-helix transcriptional regulator n=1 Tax=Haloplanus halophilus TaxID=2949993 RepID=UPI00203E629B|nr:hypothetical protein [Haloplanus sp. GDY1]
MSDTPLEYLLGSQTRPQTLTALREAGPLPVRRLEERVSASRRTLKRTLREMESRGWVYPTDGAYGLTALGAELLSAHDRFRERARVARDARPFLERIPASALDLDVDALAEATVIRPDEDTTAPVDRLLDIRDGAAELREVAPFVIRDTVDQLADRVDDDAPPDVTLVLEDAEPTPAEFSRAYCERFDDLLAASSVDVYVTPDDVPFAFGAADGHAFVGSTGRDGMPGALLEGDDPAIVDWVERSMERYLDRADPVS